MSEIEKTPDGQFQFKQSAEDKARNAAVIERERQRIADQMAERERQAKRRDNAGMNAFIASFVQVVLAGVACAVIYNKVHAYNPTPTITPLTIFAGIVAGFLVSAFIARVAAIPGIFIYDPADDYYGAGAGIGAPAMLMFLIFAGFNVWSFIILFS